MGCVDRQRQNTPLIHELILYVCKEAQKYDSFGMIHLNKIFYAADFEEFGETGQSLTGATYKKDRHGAIATCMKPILDELEKSGAIKVKTVLHFTRTQRRPIALTAPDLTQIPDNVKARIDRWIAELGPLSATAVRTRFHDQAYWVTLEKGDIVPYESVYWNHDQSRPISKKDYEIGREVAESHGLTFP